MKTTYTEYLETPKHLTIEQMENIHKQIIEEISNDEDANGIYEELVEKATKYADFRAQWFVWSRETRMERDDFGKDAAWRDELGYEEDDRYNRKAIGDFACYIVFVNSINAR